MHWEDCTVLLARISFCLSCFLKYNLNLIQRERVGGVAKGRAVAQHVQHSRKMIKVSKSEKTQLKKKVYVFYS